MNHPMGPLQLGASSEISLPISHAVSARMLMINPPADLYVHFPERIVLAPHRSFPTTVYHSITTLSTLHTVRHPGPDTFISLLRPIHRHPERHCAVDVHVHNRSDPSTSRKTFPLV